MKPLYSIMLFQSFILSHLPKIVVNLTIVIDKKCNPGFRVNVKLKGLFACQFPTEPISFFIKFGKL